MAKSRQKGKSERTAAPAEDRPLITLCMIVRDEEANLPRCLDSVRGVVDEIVIVDTGSRDRTIEIARQYTDKVYEYPWRNDFAAARNESLQHAAGRWILVLDADESLTPDTAPNLRLLTTAPLSGPRCYGLQIHNYQKFGGGDAVISYHDRFFPGDPRIRYERPIHEQVVYLGDDAELEHIATDVIHIAHHGYTPEEKRRKGKETRNIAILEKEIEANPEDCFNWFEMGLERYTRREFEESLRCHRRAISLRPNPASTHYLATAYALAAGSCVELKRYAEGVEVGEEGVKHFVSADLYCNLATAYLGLHRFPEAKGWYLRALEQRGKSNAHATDTSTSTWRPLQGLGDVHAAQGENEAALGFYEQALSFRPDNPEVLMRAAEILARLGRFEESLAHLGAVLEGNPSDEGAHLATVAVLEHAGRVQEAYDYLDALVREHPEHVGYRIRLSDLLTKAGETEASLEVLVGGIDHAPDASLYEKLAASLSSLGRHDDAASAYELALALEPGRLSAQIGMEASRIMVSVGARTA